MVKNIMLAILLLVLIGGFVYEIIIISALVVVTGVKGIISIATIASWWWIAAIAFAICLVFIGKRMLEQAVLEMKEQQVNSQG